MPLLLIYTQINPFFEICHDSKQNILIDRRYNFLDNFL